MSLSGALARYTTEGGVRYLNMHYSADPAKDAVWAARERKSFASEREWLVEMEMQEISLSGKPVHPTYRPQVHAPEYWKQHLFLPPAGTTFIVGHDAGTASLHPASVVLGILPPPHPVALLGECDFGVTTLELYLPQFLNWWRNRFPKVPVGDVYHGCDESARAREAMRGDTAQALFIRSGISITLIANTVIPRINAVDRLLADDLREGVPRFVLCERAAPMCHAALAGGYRLKEMQGSRGTVFGLPEKGPLSHLMDGLQYASVLVWEWFAAYQERAERLGRSGKPRGKKSDWSDDDD